MPSGTVLVGCRLPNGLLLQHPANRDLQVRLNGTQGRKLASGIYLPPVAVGTTEVDAEFWAAWKAAHTGYPPLKTRAIFEAKDEREAAAKAKDSGKTGFEQMPKSMVIDGQKVGQAVS